MGGQSAGISFLPHRKNAPKPSKKLLAKNINLNQ
jgi:hypothetical protein